MSKKIIIAEDDKFLANAYRIKLEKADFEIRIAADGEELLKIVPEFKPDVILLDLLMPVLDGFEALKILKENKEMHKIPVLITSNLGQESDVEKGLSLGAEDYIIKSNITLKEIIEKIKEITK